MASRVFRATATMMDVLRRFIGLSLHVEGLGNLVDRPTLFVVNHFTRMETFIVPYVLHREARRELCALADAKLFKGVFGEYLRRMGAVSTHAPLRNRRIIGDLVSGRHDWVIFPEGVMVKSKEVVRRGKLHVAHPLRAGRPHTGAAVLALKAALVRERFLEACKAGDEEVLLQLGERYGLERGRCKDFPPPVITPVNITFYPLRPDRNVVSRIATSLKPDLPDDLLEELMTEGSLLLRNTDMTIYFSPPVDVDDYLSRPMARIRKLPMLSGAQRENIVLSSQRWPLTERCMKTIYSTIAVNIDHLFCLGVREMKGDAMAIDDFHRALYLSALAIREGADRRVHASLHNDLIRIIADEPHPPLEDIAALAQKEGIVVRKGGEYRVVRNRLRQQANFRDLRLRRTTRVIANEIEPLWPAVQAVAHYVNQSTAKLREELARRLGELDLAHFEEDYRRYYDKELSKAPSVGRPFFLRAAAGATGVLLCHGYLAAPEEMRPLGEFLHDEGYTVYGARLQGFGTGPEQLRTVTWKDWVVSFNRAYAVLRNCCDRIILGGFSAGALLVLLNAARKQGGPLESIFCIDTPLILMDRRACTLAPAALGWNRLMRRMHIPATVASSIPNASETPDINYPVHNLEGVRELCNLIAVCRDNLKAVRTPCLMIHGSADPVADPHGTEVVFNKIGSAIKKRVTVEADFHNLVQRAGREKVFGEVLRFISNPSGETGTEKE